MKFLLEFLNPIGLYYMTLRILLDFHRQHKNPIGIVKKSYKICIILLNVFSMEKTKIL